MGDGERNVDYRIDPVLVATDYGALKGALLCGEGLILAADVMMKPYAEKGYVQRVLAGWTGPEYEFNAVFPRGMVQSPKVRAFVDFLVERLNFDADYMQALCPNYRCEQEAAKEAVDGRSRKSAKRAAIAAEAGSSQRRRLGRPAEKAKGPACAGPFFTEVVGGTGFEPVTPTMSR